MDMRHVRQITRERIAASQEQAARDLVRTNAMLADEVEMLRDRVGRLQAIVYGQNPACPCEGCVWWDDWGLSEPATHCENGATPNPWYSAAVDGGVPGCPNYSLHRPHNPIKPTIEIELLKFRDGIRHIDACTMSAGEMHRLKNELAGIYADHIARLIEGQMGIAPACRVCEGGQATGDDGLCDGCRGARTLARSHDRQTTACYEEVR